MNNTPANAKPRSISRLLSRFDADNGWREWDIKKNLKMICFRNSLCKLDSEGGEDNMTKVYVAWTYYDRNGHNRNKDFWMNDLQKQITKRKVERLSEI
jgi:hypothetical protein